MTKATFEKRGGQTVTGDETHRDTPRTSGTSRGVVESDASWVYEIRMKGHLDCGWRDWFGGLTVELDDCGDTLLKGPVIDQAALYGVLRRIRDLGLPLISVRRMAPPETERKGPESQPSEDGVQ